MTLFNLRHLFVVPADAKEERFLCWLATEEQLREQNQGGALGTPAHAQPFELIDGVYVRCLAEQDAPLAKPGFGAVRAWLWSTALPEGIKDRLLKFGEHEHLCVVLHARGRARVLPWEGLEPVAVGRWQLVRAHEQWEDEPVPLPKPPRVLVLIGSQQQRPGGSAAKHEVLATVQAIRDAGLSCDVAFGADALAGTTALLFRKDLRLREIEHVRALLRDPKYDVIHYIGHSDAGPGETAEHLVFEIDKAPVPLPVDEFRSLLGESRARLVVLHACQTTDAVGECLLSARSPMAVVGMTAMVPPPLCPVWSRAFYERLGPKYDHPIAEAMRHARQQLRDLKTSSGKGLRGLWQLDWVPVLWSRSPAHVAFSDKGQHVIERYCDALARETRSALGKYQMGDHELLLRDLEPVHVELSTGARSGDRLTLTELLDTEPHRWVLGGGAGAGKTTLLRHHALLWASDRHRTRVPVLVTLYGWKMKTPLREHIAAEILRSAPEWHADLRAALEALGDAGKLTFLFDGLDELSPDERQEFRAQVRLLPPGCPVLVTSRRYGTSLYVGEGFQEASLLELRPEQAGQLMGRLSGSQAIGDEWTRRFADPKTSRLLRDFGKVPLLVTLLAVLVRNRVAVAGQRHEVFDQIFEALCLGRHNRHPNPGRLLDVTDQVNRTNPTLRDREFKRRIQACLTVLGHLALEMTKARRLTMTCRELAALLEQAPEPIRRAFETLGRVADEERAFLRDVAQVTLVLAPDRVPQESEELPHPGTTFKFWHRSFQEALSARELHRRHGVDVPAILAEVDARDPAPDHVAKAEREMRDRWAQVKGAVWVDFNELWNSSLAGQVEVGSELQRLLAELQRRRNADLESGAQLADLEDKVACHLSPLRAVVEDREFWTETAALLADRLVSAHELLMALFAMDGSLCRLTIVAMDRLEPRTARDVLLGMPRFADRRALLERLTDQVEWSGALAILNELGQLLRDADPDIQTDRRGQLDLVLSALDDLDTCGWPARAKEEGLLRATGDLAGLDTDDPALLTQVATRPGIQLWRPVPPGSFVMGSADSDPGCGADERPAHRVELHREIWMGATPVTVAQYRRFDPWHRIWFEGRYQEITTLRAADSLPVTMVSWHAARGFCRWATLHWVPRLPLRTATAGPLEIRMPTEAEWEYATRAGSSHRFFFGDDPADLPLYAWSGDADGEVRAVGTKRGRPGDPRAGANDWGLFDVHGNVWEWCQDWYGQYFALLAHDPRGPEHGRVRVLRGGSYLNSAGRCSCSFRNWYDPGGALRSVGFRLVLSTAQRGDR